MATANFKKSSKLDGIVNRHFLSDWEACRDRHLGPRTVLESVLVDKLQYVFYRAGRKGAKTTTGIDIAWVLANEAPNRVGYLCYPTIAQGIEVIWEERRLQTCDLKNDSMFEKYVEKVDEVRHIVRFTNGSFIKLIGTWTDAKGRGQQPDFVIYDEVQDCSGLFIEAMDANFAAKEHSQCVYMGTPPKKRNHYEELLEMVASNPRGKVHHFNSYDNTSLPHLKEWLDNKKIELTKANKEDVWLREYMAELCYSSSDRVLPDAKFMEKEEIDNLARNFDYNESIPILGVCVHPSYFIALYCILVRKKHILIMDHFVIPQVWDQSSSEMYSLLGEKAKQLQNLCAKKMHQVVWDESKAFVDIVSGFSLCRKDLKWQDRGIPLLRELMVKDKIHFSREIAALGIECQNLLQDENEKDIQKNYPHICALAMISNEYFSQEKISLPSTKPFDKYAAFREMGIPYTPKKRGKPLFGFKS
jgi:hypothetical protein